MTSLRLFISSVQSEFVQERAALRDYVRGDALLCQFFDVFLFEDVPALNQRPDALYLDEVAQCDVYIGLFGFGYGSEDEAGVAPTEREFDRASALGVHRLIFVKGEDDSARHPKMRALLDKAQAGLIRKRFNTTEELKDELFSALVAYLKNEELIRTGPFDAAVCPRSTLDDLDSERVRWFIRRARRARQFPLAEEASPEELLAQLNLLNNGRLTHAAVLLFGKLPQRFLISSEVKCAHFHGTEVAKPIPSYQVYKGTVFALVDQAVDFVLSKIALHVGTRAESVRAPVTYEMPKEVVTEAIVNAVAHRDYTSNGSVQVMLFADRLEVRNPGRLLHPLTLEKLREPHNSLPVNALLAESLYLAEYIERMGTGTLDMIRRCVGAGLSEPEFAVTDGFVTTVRRKALAGRVMEEPESQPELQLELQPESEMEKGQEKGQVGQAEAKLRPSQGQVEGQVEGQVDGQAEQKPESQPESGGERVQAEGQVDQAEAKLRPSWGQVGQEPESRPESQPKSGEERVQDGVQVGQADGQAEQKPESQLELQPEALEVRVLRLLIGGAMSKAELSKNLGQKTVSGQLNKVVRLLVADGMIAFTLPDKPRSRLQKYRLTDEGRAAVAISKRAERSART